MVGLQSTDCTPCEDGTEVLKVLKELEPLCPPCIVPKPREVFIPLEPPAPEFRYAKVECNSTELVKVIVNSKFCIERPKCPTRRSL